MTIPFKTQYDEHPRLYCEPGDGIKTTYIARYSDLGILELVAQGKEDLYGYIQSHAESVDIHVILERFAAGDTDVLSRTQGFYADITGLPKTYSEVLNAVLAGEQAFDHLPIEIKQQFNNSFAEWMASMDTEEFSVKMGFVRDDMTDQQKQDFMTNSDTQPSSSEVVSVSPPGGDVK